MAISQEDWQAIVDAAINDFGLEPDDIPTGAITASTGGEELSFRSRYRG